MRTERVFVPQSTAEIALTMLARAAALSAGGTLSSRSRLTTSAALAAIFGKSSGREPGPNSWQRFGRAGGLLGMVKLMRAHSSQLFAVAQMARRTGGCQRGGPWSGGRGGL